MGTQQQPQEPQRQQPSAPCMGVSSWGCAWTWCTPCDAQPRDEEVFAKASDLSDEKYCHAWSTSSDGTKLWASSEEEAFLVQKQAFTQSATRISSCDTACSEHLNFQQCMGNEQCSTSWSECSTLMSSTTTGEAAENREDTSKRQDMRSVEATIGLKLLANMYRQRLSSRKSVCKHDSELQLHGSLPPKTFLGKTAIDRKPSKAFSRFATSVEDRFVEPGQMTDVFGRPIMNYRHA